MTDATAKKSPPPSKSRLAGCGPTTPESKSSGSTGIFTWRTTTNAKRAWGVNLLLTSVV